MGDSNLSRPVGVGKPALAGLDVGKKGQRVESMKKGDSVSIGDKNATIKWVVDTEVGVIFDNGETAVIDSIKCPITILVESAPVYQTSVEHMTDEQLRASIEELRNRRILKPLTKTKVTVKEEPVSEEHKKIDAIFKGKTPEEIIVLKRKLGWID